MIRASSVVRHSEAGPPQGKSVGDQGKTARVLLLLQVNVHPCRSRTQKVFSPWQEFRLDKVPDNMLTLNTPDVPDLSWGARKRLFVTGWTETEDRPAAPRNSVAETSTEQPGLTI